MTMQPSYAPQPVKALDSDKILTNPDEWQRDLVGNVAGAVQQMMTQNNVGTYEALATSAKHLSRSDPKVAPVWDKYGAEIEALAGSPQINPQLRGSKEFWDQTTRVVQAQHLDDIVAERATAMAAEMRTGTETGAGSYGASDPADSSAMDKLRESPYGKTLLAKYGERGIMRNVEKLGVTLDKYADMVADTNIIVNPNNASEWHNRDLMRGR